MEATKLCLSRDETSIYSIYELLCFCDSIVASAREPAPLVAIIAAIASHEERVVSVILGSEWVGTVVASRSVEHPLIVYVKISDY